MNPGSGVLSGYPTTHTPARVPSLTANLTGTEACSPQLPRDNHSSTTAEPRPSTTYQVSINMTCTGTQLEAVMVGLTGAGTSIDMKIQPGP